MKSLRLKVFLGVLCGLLLVTTAAEVLLYRQATSFAEKELFTSLKKYAIALSNVGFGNADLGFTLYPDWGNRLRISPEDYAKFFEFKTIDGDYITDSHNLGGDNLPDVGQHDGQKLIDYGNVVLGVYEYHFEVGGEGQPTLPLKLLVADNTDLISGARRSTIRTLLYFTPIALIAAFLISFALTAATLSSISRFTKRVQTYNRVDNKTHVDLNSIDTEMRPLGEALNKYLYQLNKHANQESKLLADTAHELRTPLGRMHKSLTMLKQASDSPDEFLIHAGNLDNDLFGLQVMTENMLMLYRIESGNYQPRLESLDLSKELDPIVQSYNASKNLAIELQGQNITVYSNRSVINLITTRLLDNAIRHASGSKISILLETKRNTVELHVDDGGSGIEESDREQIFDRRYQFENRKQSVTSGSGLGLVLVRLYANSVNARVLCADSPLGGARFTVVFPATAPAENKQQSNTVIPKLEGASS